MRHIIKLNLVQFFVAFVIFVPSILHGQVKMKHPIYLQWNGVAAQRVASDTLYYMDLESGVYESAMPVYYQSFPIYDDAVKVELELLNVTAEPLTVEEMHVAHNYGYSADYFGASLGYDIRVNNNFIIGFDYTGARYGAENNDEKGWN